MVNYRSWADRKTGYDKKDYVPLDERDDWDGQVIKVKNYKDHKWTGTQFDSKNGKKR